MTTSNNSQQSSQPTYYISPQLPPGSYLMGMSGSSSGSGGACPVVDQIVVVSNATKIDDDEFSALQSHTSQKATLKAELASGSCNDITWETVASSGCVAGEISQTDCEVEIDLDEDKTVCLRVKCDLDDSILWEGTLVIKEVPDPACPVVDQVVVVSNATKESSTEFSASQSYTGEKATLKVELTSGSCSGITWESVSASGCESGEITQTDCEVEIDLVDAKTVCLKVKCNIDDSTLWSGTLAIDSVPEPSCPTITEVTALENAVRDSDDEYHFVAVKQVGKKAKLKATMGSGSCSDIMWVSSDGSGCEEGEITPSDCEVEIDLDEAKTICLKIICKANIYNVLWEGTIEVGSIITLLCPPGSGGTCSSCGCESSTTCQCNQNGTQSVTPFTNPILNMANTLGNMFSDICELIAPSTGRSSPAPSPYTGNLSDTWDTPQAGPLDIKPTLSYNSLRSGFNSPFGYGVSNFHSSRIDTSGDGATLHDGQGHSYFYTDKDTNDKYLAPHNSGSALEELSSGGWKETPANGFAKHYCLASHGIVV